MWSIVIGLIAVLVFQLACATPAQERARVKAERKPFVKSSSVIKAPKEYAMREYDPRPRVVEVDKEAGKYELRWIGYDGKEKIVAYQRKDAIDAIVEATVIRQGENYEYKYLIRNLSSSPSYFGSFIVQTLAADIQDKHIRTGEDLSIGHMASYIPHFSNGVWRAFAPLGEKNWILPGTTREFRLVSAGRPGIVGCNGRAGGSTIKGVGEHMPQELELSTPGFDGYARCHTIGPVDSLSKMSKPERIQYFLDNLPKFEEAGWMAGDTPKIYEAILKRNDLAGALEQAKKDLANEYITSEVFHIIEGLNY